MTDVKPWDTIHRERAALAVDLARLDDEQWLTRSLCGDWTVEQTLGHMTAAASTSPPKWMARFACRRSSAEAVDRVRGLQHGERHVAHRDPARGDALLGAVVRVAVHREVGAGAVDRFAEEVAAQERVDLESLRAAACPSPARSG